MINIQFPVEQQDIAAYMKQIDFKLNKINQEFKAVQDLKKMLQDACAHPKKYYGSNCGENWTKCAVCHKEI